MSVTPIATKYRECTATDRDADQLARRELAKGAWAEGRIDNALLILESVLSEEMSPAVAVQCYITSAAFCAGQGRWIDSLNALSLAAPLLDSASVYTQGNFFHQRARVHKHMGNFDAALMDYTGAASCYEQAECLEYVGSTNNNLAWVWIEIGDFDKAEERIRYTLKVYSTIATEYIGPAYDTLANVLLRKGLLTKALENADLAVEKSATKEDWLCTALTTRGIIKSKMGRAGAKADFDHAIRLSEENNFNPGIGAACCAAIKSLELPLTDLIAYYKKASPICGPELKECADIVIDALPCGTIEEMEVDLVKRALIKTDGSITRAAKLVGLTHKGVDCIVNRHPKELLRFRKERRFRGKPLPLKK